MKTIKFLIIMLFCFASATNAWSQDDKESKRVQTEKNTKPFVLNYFTSSENRLYVMDVAVVNNAIIIDATTTISEVPGKLPYPSGDFNVSVIGADNQLIANYNMLDPVLQRSCEKGSNHLSFMENGRIQISLPKNNTITRVILKRDKEEIANLDIAALIKEVIREDTDKN